MTGLWLQGFDDVFFRCFNYYLCYCEAASTSKVKHTPGLLLKANAESTEPKRLFFLNGLF